MLLVLTLAGLGWSAAQYLEATRIERAATDIGAVAAASAEAMDAELDDRRAQLVDAELVLGAADAGLAAWLGDLTTRIDDRHALTGEIAALRRQLDELRGTISGTESEAAAAAALRGALATCLDGVTELLNQLSVGDDAGAAATLGRIGPACATVGTVLR